MRGKHAREEMLSRFQDFKISRLRITSKGFSTRLLLALPGAQVLIPADSRS